MPLQEYHLRLCKNTIYAFARIPSTPLQEYHLRLCKNTIYAFNTKGGSAASALQGGFAAMEGEVPPEPQSVLDMESEVPPEP